MKRAVQCPSCGAQHEIKNPGIKALRCEFCGTFFYWDAQAVHDTGVKAVLDPPSSALRVGEIASLDGQEMFILGRVRYSYGSGIWDEWFLDGPGETIVWITEDEKELVREQPVDPDSSFPAAEDLQVSQRVSLHGTPYVVEEAGRATCLGVEGQVPFVVIPNEVYAFADLARAEGEGSAGVEYDNDGAPTFFTGEFLARDAVKVAGGSVFPDVVASGAAITCDGCGSPIEGRFPPDTEMLVCGSCGAGLELSGTETKVVTQNQEQPRFDLDIGDVGKLVDGSYEVVGRMRYVQLDEGLEYPAHEYLLWNTERGYVWLEEENGHWIMNRRSHQQPSRDPFEIWTARTEVKVGGQSFRFVEQGDTALRYVDGAMPWVATVGERYRFADLVAPPLAFSAELSATGDTSEVEYFSGRYVPTAELKQAFGRSFPDPVGIGMAQPIALSGSQKFAVGVSLAVAFINLAVMAVVCLPSGTEVFRTTVTAEQYRTEHLSEPFEIKGDLPVVELSGAASVDNAWVTIDVALVNAEDQVYAETFGDVSYYHGYEGGESWSEGSQDFSELIRVDKPGTYRLLVYGTAGTGDQAAPAGGPPVSLRVVDGVRRSLWFLLVFLLALPYPALAIFNRVRQEAQRFGIEIELDDD